MCWSTNSFQKWVNGIDRIIVFSMCVCMCTKYTGKIYTRKRYFMFRINRVCAFVCVCVDHLTLYGLHNLPDADIKTKISVEPNLCFMCFLVALFKLYRICFYYFLLDFRHFFIFFLSPSLPLTWRDIARTLLLLFEGGNGSCHWICGLWSREQYVQIWF